MPFNYVHFTHILFSIVFAVAYCVLVEKFPKITLWQGVAVGILVNIAVYVITLPILGLTPPLLRCLGTSTFLSLSDTRYGFGLSRL